MGQSHTIAIFIQLLVVSAEPFQERDTHICRGTHFCLRILSIFADSALWKASISFERVDTEGANIGSAGAMAFKSRMDLTNLEVSLTLCYHLGNPDTVFPAI